MLNIIDSITYFTRQNKRLCLDVLRFPQTFPTRTPLYCMYYDSMNSLSQGSSDGLEPTLLPFTCCPLIHCLDIDCWT